MTETKHDPKRPNSGLGRRRRAAISSGGETYSVRRQEIIQAAAYVFREKGFERATLNDVAERLGTDRASLYYYVSGKEELLRDVVCDMVADNVAETARIAASDLPPPEKVRLFIEQLMRSYETNYPQMYVFIEQDLGRALQQPSALASQLDMASRQCEGQFISILEEGVRTGDFYDDVPLSLVANAMFGMVNWTFRWFKPNRRYSGQDVADYFARLMLRAVRRSTEC